MHVDGEIDFAAGRCATFGDQFRHDVLRLR
jgi:hypothetical protein